MIEFQRRPQVLRRPSRPGRLLAHHSRGQTTVLMGILGDREERGAQAYRRPAGARPRPRRCGRAGGERSRLRRSDAARGPHRVRLPVRRAVRLAHVRDNLSLGLRRQGLPRTGRSRRGWPRVSELVELPDAESRFPAELSGGMRKRVGIARAIALRPRYILYDEPTTGLDPVTTVAMDDLMIRARRELGATSVVVTHDLAARLPSPTGLPFCTRAGSGRSARCRRSARRPIPWCANSFTPRPGTGGPA